VDLSQLVVGHDLATGAHLTIRFSLRFYVGQVSTFTITSSGPRRQVTCLAPGSTKPGRRC
jgi:hypothetical protein